MSDGMCVKCGRKVSGELEGVRLSICCMDCCKRYKADTGGRYAGSHRLSRTRARFGFPEFDKLLDDLDSQTFSLSALGEPVLGLYLGAEALRVVKKARGEHKIAVDRKGELSRILGFEVGDVDPIALVFAYKKLANHNYFSSSSLESTKKLLSQIERVVEIRRACPRAHPEAVFDFCLEHPNGGPVEFCELKEKVTKVIPLEGFNIVRHLTKAESDMLLDSPLREAVEQFRQRDRQGIIRSFLEKWRTAEVVEAMLQHPACQLRIQREEDGDPETALKILSFWELKDDAELREIELQDAFKDAGVIRPRDKEYCRIYIAGDVDCDPKEIVGVHLVLSGNYGKNKRLKSERSRVALTKFEENFCELKMPLTRSVAVAIQDSMNVLPIVLKETCSWDYKELTKGYWSQRIRKL